MNQDGLKSRSLAKVVTVSFAVLAAILGALAALAYSCGHMLHTVDGMCDNETLGEYASPDGRYKVVVFERDCGSTTDFSTQASVLESQAQLPNEAGNVFMAKAGSAPSGRGGGPELRVRWTGARHAVLSHHEGVATFLAVHEHEGVTIAYEAFRR